MIRYNIKAVAAAMSTISMAALAGEETVPAQACDTASVLIAKRRRF